ncbi:glycosyltransferase family 4 protein [Desulfosporosinus sp. SYSU MS00001]|uniref:glycosyltransferase family 4 protein n=1 Tax=Desulfosporosinus sp. SYSU MS00001 TaxID=3416284 RepID=UPI003CF69DF2
MKYTYVINGKFMADRMMGIVRYASELVRTLDKYLTNDEYVTLLLPPNAKDVPNYMNIHIEKYGIHSGMLWEQVDLARYMNRHKEAICLNLCNVAPFFSRPGITTIHDIMYKANPLHYTTLRNKLSRYWHIFQYWFTTHREIVVLTVSDYSKGEIIRYYPAAKEKVKVIPNAWQHVLNYNDSLDWQQRYPFLSPGSYFFSLATLAKNKNGRWILEAAHKNPDLTFVIAGKHYETDNVIEIPQNVHILGFISDEDACSLIKNCRAFLFPSIYEGFGLPPLEALALGANVISSNATSLPEVLGNSVHYISPDNANVNLDQILEEPVEDKQNTLCRFSWDMSASMLLEVMQKYAIHSN